MENGSRKATDIILSLEQQVKNLVTMISSQDLLLKIISNKLIELTNSLQKTENNKFIVESVNSVSHPGAFVRHPNIDPEKQVLISSEEILQEEHSPKGFRRTSRPETFAGDNSFLNKTPKKKAEEVSFPVQIPRSNGKAEVVVPDMAVNVNKSQSNKVSDKQANTKNNVPTMQRIVDRNGKSVFLADVEIIDLSTVETILKTRTNGTGKWQASLPIGEYKVIIKKLESLTKQKVEVAQTIKVDGTQSPLELSMMIIK